MVCRKPATASRGVTPPLWQARADAEELYGDLGDAMDHYSPDTVLMKLIPPDPPARADRNS